MFPADVADERRCLFLINRRERKERREKTFRFLTSNL